MRFPGLLVAVLAILAWLPAERAAAQCAGFTDVASGGFCGQVTWIKNRQITVGCTSSTTYCPNDAVARVSMAAFMNRLGNVLTTRVLDEEANGTALDLVVGPHFLCETDEVAPVNYPRTMVARALITYTLTGMQDVSFGVSTATDGGNYSSGSPLIARNGVGVHQQAYFSTQQPLAAGSSYRFAVRIGRFGSQTAGFAAWGCQLQVDVANAFGSQ